jgi:hypothetical protein
MVTETSIWNINYLGDKFTKKKKITEIMWKTGDFEHSTPFATEVLALNAFKTEECSVLRHLMLYCGRVQNFFQRNLPPPALGSSHYTSVHICKTPWQLILESSSSVTHHCQNLKTPYTFKIVSFMNIITYQDMATECVCVCVCVKNEINYSLML